MSEESPVEVIGDSAAQLQQETPYFGDASGTTAKNSSSNGVELA